MELEERARATGDLASRLATEALDPLSQAELDARIALLTAEIERVRAHAAKAQAHRLAAESLFRTPSSPPATGSPGSVTK
ncbi:DUF1192 domain-containing protein [Novosphingobium sp. FKTRR1]|uniref:DUF1192 domain-containing protein n=1 Tax=unclassified Novosphingobium TaxID=2644732 RepID=UPI001CF00C05|nr:DUF1192 domain-containing protein [Novosphingobium sp. FKTRR1]